jgi:coproporphyrinogen III oxidase-like Fe-S oxidoreductase
MEQLRLETLYLGLRTRKGFYLEDFKDQYDCDLFTERKDMLDKLQKEGLVSVQNGHLYPTRPGSCR